eukprot:TRINITY_DN8249_c0_g1_i1.p1 TRINITY_DN8249_c0_g1~~TRINITY_DN8249_c0_g1_i1.p1  ORF type:complete len:130 (+),score=15.54 TRINITY_DN8249_c0_g1_i1:28-390(+)
MVRVVSVTVYEGDTISLETVIDKLNQYSHCCFDFRTYTGKNSQGKLWTICVKCQLKHTRYIINGLLDIGVSEISGIIDITELESTLPRLHKIMGAPSRKSAYDRLPGEEIYQRIIGEARV